MEQTLEAYISREIPSLLKNYSLVAVNETLPGEIRVDFHFKNQEGVNLFVEVLGRKIGRMALGQILNMYTSISNIEPALEKFKLLVVGPEINHSIAKELRKLPIKLLTYEEIGILPQKLREIQADRQLQQQRLSPQEAKLVARWESEKKTIIRPSDVEQSLHCSKNHVYFLLHNLERKHWLERITKGLYQFIPLSYGYPDRIPPANSFAVGASLTKHYYFSYYTSNSFYGYTTQMPFTLFIATTQKKTSFEWANNTYKFITLSKRKFFGYKSVKAFDATVKMAEPEKSLIDSFDKPKYAGGIEQLVRVTWRGLQKANMEKLVSYAEMMGSHALVQRLGFIIDLLVAENLIEPLSSSLRHMLSSRIGNSVIYLDPRKPRTGKFSKEWKIIDNIPRSQLLSEIEVR